MTKMIEILMEIDVCTMINIQNNDRLLLFGKFSQRDVEKSREKRE